MQIRTFFNLYTTCRQEILRYAGATGLVLVLAACGPAAEDPIPTRAPAPTFTPTTEVAVAPVDPAAVATAQAIATAAASAANQPAANPVQPTPLPEQPTDTPPPTDTPAPTDTPNAQVIISSNINVRGGPGTTHPIIGTANQGQAFPVKGKNSAGDWWLIDYNGRDGWVFGELVQAQNTQAVAVAQNIPTPPPPPPTPIPQPTPVPQPQPEQPAPQPEQPAPQPEQPAPPPQQSYEFNRALLQKCAPNAGVTYVEGTTYKGGQPVNGYTVVFSYAPDGPIVASMLSGPHDGYPGWRTGFYSHIIGHNGPREGDWYFWIIDGEGKRISQIAHVHTDGSAGDGKCQQAVIDFDS